MYNRESLYRIFSHYRLHLTSTTAILESTIFDSLILRNNNVDII